MITNKPTPFTDKQIAAEIDRMEPLVAEGGYGNYEGTPREGATAKMADRVKARARRIERWEIDHERLRVLVVKDKHEDYVYDATGDKIYDVARELVQERATQRWYFDDPGTFEEFLANKNAYEFSKMKPNPEPELIVDKAWEAKWVDEQRKKWKAECIEWEHFRAVLDDESGELALDFLHERVGYAYEYMIVEYPIDVSEKT